MIFGKLLGFIQSFNDSHYFLVKLTLFGHSYISMYLLFLAGKLNTSIDLLVGSSSVGSSTILTTAMLANHWYMYHLILLMCMRVNPYLLAVLIVHIVLKIISR